jgi:hypothetical protein
MLDLSRVRVHGTLDVSDARFTMFMIPPLPRPPSIQVARGMEWIRPWAFLHQAAPAVIPLIYPCQLSAGSVAMTLGDYHREAMNAIVCGESVTERARLRVRFLALVESSARQNGDVTLANVALYDRLGIESADHGLVSRALDTIFYKGVAGYYIRWTHPLIALLILIATISFFRWCVGEGNRHPAVRLLEQSSSRAFADSLRRLKHAAIDTMSIAVHRQDFALKDTDRLRLDLLRFVIRVGTIALIALFVLDIASYNSTVHDFIEALHL